MSRNFAPFVIASSRPLRVYWFVCKYVYLVWWKYVLTHSGTFLLCWPHGGVEPHEEASLEWVGWGIKRLGNMGKVIKIKRNRKNKPDSTSDHNRLAYVAITFPHLFQFLISILSIYDSLHGRKPHVNEFWYLGHLGGGGGKGKVINHCTD